MRALLVGFGISNEAIAQRLRAEGARMLLTNDAPLGAERHAVVEALGIERWSGKGDLPVDLDVVIPSPGVPWNHPVVEAAERIGVPVEGELGIAARRTNAPIVGVTGTNGKTTVTTLVTAMLVASQKRAVGAGNIGLPLIEAIDVDVDVLVTEVSSFQLYYAAEFHPKVATWLNIAPEHLDWHPDMDHYIRSKARLWKHMDRHDTAVLNGADAAVLGSFEGVSSPRVTFGTKPTDDWSVDKARGVLRGPGGEPFVEIADLGRRNHIDLLNAVAATATAMAAGANLDACAETLFAFTGLPHRQEQIAEIEGVTFYDDSEATNASATAAGLASSRAAVLITAPETVAGLEALRHVGDRLRAIVVMGDASTAVQSAFAGTVGVSIATSMEQAVEMAMVAARPGDAIVYSPASQPSSEYRNEAERGDHFTRTVRGRS